MDVRLPGPGEPPLLPWPGEVREAGPYRLFVRTAPGGPGAEPALYVHGLGGASTNWTDLMHLLSPRLAGEAVDLPGFGHSDPPPDGAYALETHIRAVTALLKQRGPVHLFGNSLGGAVATRIAADRPELVRTLTLISPALPLLRPRRFTDTQILLLMLPGVTALARRRFSLLPAEQRSRRVLELCFADPRRVPPERRLEAAEELRRRDGLGWSSEALIGSLRGLIASYLSYGGRTMWRAAARVQVPTLLIWGRHDRLVDVRVGYRAQQVFPNAGLLVIGDGGHVSQLEHPETVARAVRDLLDGSLARAA